MKDGFMLICNKCGNEVEINSDSLKDALIDFYFNECREEYVFKCKCGNEIEKGE
jgi:hypothetical protein